MFMIGWMRVRRGPRRRNPLGPLAACCAALGLFALPARADLSPLLIDIQASNARGWGAFQVVLEEGSRDAKTGDVWWTLAAPVTIRDQMTSAPIALLNGLSVRYVADPVIELDFDVFAKDMATNFVIDSSLLSFPDIVDAQGRAHMAITLSDEDNNGASLQGMGPLGGAYLAHYNGMVPGGTSFAEVISSMNTVPGGILSVDVDIPAGGGFTDIPDVVGNMSARFAFQLSANDHAVGESRYQIVPAPATLGLLAIGAVGLRRRRRRR